MKKSVIRLSLLVFFATTMTNITAHALSMIPPYYFSVQEISAILASKEVAEKITSGRMIDGITRNGHSYEIKAQECTLNVDVEYQLVDQDPTTDTMWPNRRMVLKVGELLCFHTMSVE